MTTQPISNVKTNVPELDSVLKKIISGTNICILGKPGSGKTSLCLTIIKNSIISAKERIIYFTTKEKPESIINYGLNFDIDLQKKIEENQFYIEFLRPVDIKMMAKNESIKIFELAQAYNANKIIIDSFNYITDAFDTKYEKMTYSLKIINDISNYCPLLIVTYDISSSNYGKKILEYISDINIMLNFKLNEKDNKIYRKLKILKARGIETNRHNLDFEIQPNKGVVFSNTSYINPNVQSQNQQKPFEKILQK
ncbi:MAG: RAD55 family ATPase [Candidatus Micrarchaeota archaeon]|nr:RAD55 family ATPase [Candidatus Micrarchaeota archaeon]